VKFISAFILRLLGWKIIGDVDKSLKKYVMIIAPHTSFMDFIIGRLAFNVLNIKVKFLIKKEFFFFPLGYIVKTLGGLPVDRSKSSNLVSQVTRLFDNNKKLAVAITPEGTRKLNKHWKKGFYFIALKAGVPIIPGYLDYKHKIAGIGEQMQPSGNFEKDFAILKEFYKGRNARYPENYNLS